ncbi:MULTISPECIES: c-type cytochrome [Myroides]|uniref:C-type cytochrome n=1 Tax=Myroides albus TaxID=2562892 RepID=A0A6I3LIU9_9FLAO|nr:MULTISPECIES: cytochrome c [Myroides]MTG98163.1 c-type cytochrome [Myroides albus]MVX35335.1 c-type cytochrome [Myroides sp. LoEW2-1]UVD78651.1 cytochrome c [Myroides albus]
MNNTPLPKDIPLDLPLPEWLLVILLVVSFLAHIVFVNLMVGGSIATLWAEIKGLKNKEYDVLAQEIAATITVNKSLAVVLGVAPLLSINALYTIYFYTANSLTGIMWILIIPLVAIVFLLTYLHKYTWEAMSNMKLLHISINALAVAMFLFIPLIFLVNINLMLFPEKWMSVRGFLSALALPNVFPRYFHFICASLALTGLFITWYMGRKNYPFEEYFKVFTRAKVKRIGYQLALGASVAQFLFGPIVMATLPAKGFSWAMMGVILSGVAVAVYAVYYMIQTLRGTDEQLDRYFKRIVISMGIVVVFMGSGRHVYRANAINPHRELMAQKTAAFEQASKEAREQAANAQEEEKQAIANAEASGDNTAKGKAVFNSYCAACHKEKTQLVGPPVTEMQEIYANNKTDLIKWIKSPGKKRPDAPQMPPFPQINEGDMEDLTQYILNIK